MVILSGGEALARPDVLDLAAHGTGLGLRMTLATNGSLVTRRSPPPSGIRGSSAYP
jgi:MoaA/NifB/PqqE/SkfB family radical SAM enzyme